MMIPQDKIQEITGRADIIEIIGGYVSLKPSGRSYLGLCPFHNEKTPSFSVNPDRKFYHCFGCGKGGTVFTFLMEMEGLTFTEAAEKLAAKTGVTLDSRPRERGGEERNSLHRELCRRTAGSFHYLLTHSPQGQGARDYLARRGVSGEMTALFELGYAPGDSRWLYRFLRKKNYSPEFLGASGLFSRNHPEAAIFWNRLIFPIKSPSGEHIGFGGRLLSGEGPKYVNSPETPVFLKRNNLYGLSEAARGIRKTGEFILVEGYLDAIAFFQAEIPRAVAPLGTSFTPEQARLLRRYAPQGLIIFDGDEAGQKAALRAVKICQEEGIASRVVVIPENQDPAEILQKQGAEGLHNLLKSAISDFDFILGGILSRRDPRIPEEKEAILKELAPYFQVIESQTRREGLIRRLSDLLEVEYQTITGDLKRLERHEAKAGKEHGYNQEKLSKQLYLMLAVAAIQGQFSFIRDHLELEELTDPDARELYIILEENFRHNLGNDPAILTRIDNPRLVSLLTSRLASGEFSPEDPEVGNRLIRQSLAEVKRERIRMTQEGINRQLAHLRRLGGDPALEEKLLGEKMFLDKESEQLRVSGNDRFTD
ncbi:MAG: DNA primase [Spirochaetales bacterium]|jgi:DNA primase|nr:DNA primase [Spirochaetales bacterium]